MKYLVLAGVFSAFCLQAKAQPVQHYGNPQKFLSETRQQTAICESQFGPKEGAVLTFAGNEQSDEYSESLHGEWGCIFKKKGIIDDKGDVNFDILEGYVTDLLLILATPSPELTRTAHQITLECKDEQGEDYGEKSLKIQNCVTIKGFDFVKRIFGSSFTVLGKYQFKEH